MDRRADDACWRCDAAPAGARLGLCHRCHDDLVDADTTAPDPLADEDLVTMCDVWMPGLFIGEWQHRPPGPDDPDT